MPNDEIVITLPIKFALKRGDLDRPTLLWSHLLSLKQLN